MFKKGFIAGAILGSITISGIAYAASAITVLVDGEKLQAEVEPQMADGTTLVPARALSEALGAQVVWDDANSTVLISSGKNALQIRQLESALQPKTPEQAAKAYAEAVKTRNGAWQFALLSEDLRKAFRNDFESFNWVTGTSSPWVEEYSVQGAQVSDTEWRYRIDYVWTSSTRERVPSSETVYVTKDGDNWRISENGMSLSVPFNINPVTVFFKYLFIDPDHSQEQVDASRSDLNAGSFAQGLTQANLTELLETGSAGKQLEFRATIDVKRSPDYSGPLSEGANTLYFVVEKKGERTFRILSWSTSPVLSGGK